MNKIRTAIFGGSFDPIHLGHVLLARTVLERGLSDEVWFLVTPLNPHKQGVLLADEKDRFEMAQLAVSCEHGMAVSDIEFGLPRPSYTINTLEALEQKYPLREFLLLMGADNWTKIDKWYKSDEILSRFGIIVYPRGDEKKNELPDNVYWLQSVLHDISSTEIRRFLSERKDVSKWLHPDVLNYIKKRKLYNSVL